MNICIDMRPALSRPTGVGTYLQNLVGALAELDRQNQYYLFSSSWKERYPSDSYPANFRIVDRKWPVSALNYTWNHFSFPKIESLIGTDVQVTHSPTPLVIPSRTARSITTVHDLFFFTNPEHAIREMKTDYVRLLRKHCMKSNAIIAVSEHTKNKLVELLRIPSSQIYTIRHGIDPFYLERSCPENSSKVLERLRIRRPFLLFVGTREPRKNLGVLLEAVRTLGDRVSLVIAGQPGWGPDQPDVPENSIVTGYLPKSDLRALYQSAVAVVFPSIEEGFGLPLVEGMASEVPLIASRIPAFQEVCNDSCLYFDPLDVEELTEQIRSVLRNDSLRNTLISRGKERVKKFSWKNAAQKTLDLYMSL